MDQVNNSKDMPGNNGEFEESSSRIDVASQWQMVWWKFRKHNLAIIGGSIVLFLYTIALFAEFLAPGLPGDYNARYTYAPPQKLHFLDKTEDGTKFGMYVNGYKSKIDKVALRRTFVLDETKKYEIGFFVVGKPYKLWGMIPMERHLLGAKDTNAPFYLLGADRLGRDRFTRIIYGTRISMSIGLVGVLLSLILGIMLGGISGYYGGTVDTIIQRIIEFLKSMPTIPLWMGLAAAIPLTWPPLRVYFGITIILSFIGWTGLAREVRGKVFYFKTEDFVTAARLDGVSEPKIIGRHMVPLFISHIIASTTLAIPIMILSETSLSFLGIGLRPPVVSWGVLLKEAQNIRSVATAPWLLMPGLFVIISVLSLNFLGDGLRDAADPYSK